MATLSQKFLIRIAPWLLPVGSVIIWQFASSIGWLSTRILPSPEGVLKAFWTLSASGEENACWIPLFRCYVTCRTSP